MTSLILNLLRQTALAKIAKVPTSFSVIASNFVCRLVNSVEFDSSDRILIFFSFKKYSW